MSEKSREFEFCYVVTITCISVNNPTISLVVGLFACTDGATLVIVNGMKSKHCQYIICFSYENCRLYSLL